MSKMSIDPQRHALNGPTMGTRWSAAFYAKAGFDPAPLQMALQAAVDEIDAQMSCWNKASELMRFNAAPPGVWVELPAHLMTVLRLGLEIGHASNGAFDIGMGDAVTAWGFGPQAPDQQHILEALKAPRQPAFSVLELDPTAPRVRKKAPITLDLNGIAKGYGVDRLTETLRDFGINSALCGIDGEMRAHGLRPDDEPWAIAVEAPTLKRREPHSLLVLQDAAVATSGDYRHRIVVGGRHLSHTMDPQRGAPLNASPAGVTVVAKSCAAADGWATALMVAGPEKGAALARHQRLDALFLLRKGDKTEPLPVGTLFGAPPHQAAR